MVTFKGFLKRGITPTTKRFLGGTTFKEEAKRFGKGLLIAGGIAAAVVTKGKLLTPLIPKSPLGKTLAVAGGLVSFGALKESKRVRQAVVAAPKALIQTGTQVGKVIEEPPTAPKIPLALGLGGVGALLAGAGILAAKKLKDKPPKIIPTAIPASLVPSKVAPLGTLVEEKVPDAKPLVQKAPPFTNIVQIQNIMR